MPNCSICLENIQLINSCDKCSYCKKCFTTYICLQIQQGFDTIPCPQCRQILDSDFIEKEAETLELNEAKFEYYLRSQDDVRSCPIEGCPYKGFIVLKPCSELLECQICQSEWRDKDLIKHELSKQILDIIQEFRFMERFQDFQSYLCQELISNKCPQCSVPIVKNDGCSHITCIQCKYEFCWYCLQKHQNHKQNSYKQIIHLCSQLHDQSSNKLNNSLQYNDSFEPLLICFRIFIHHWKFHFKINSLQCYLLYQLPYSKQLNTIITSKILKQLFFLLILENIIDNYRWQSQFKTEVCLFLLTLQFVGYYQMACISILIMNLIPEFIFLVLVSFSHKTVYFLWDRWIKHVE